MLSRAPGPGSSGAGLLAGTAADSDARVVGSKTLRAWQQPRRLVAGAAAYSLGRTYCRQSVDSSAGEPGSSSAALGRGGTAAGPHLCDQVGIGTKALAATTALSAKLWEQGADVAKGQGCWPGCWVGKAVARVPRGRRRTGQGGWPWVPSSAAVPHCQAAKQAQHGQAGAAPPAQPP